MNKKIKNQTARIGVVGLGYVGLPLAIEFGKKYNTLGFDINNTRIKELNSGFDHTLECSCEQIRNSPNLKFSMNVEELKDCDIYIITVPTPIDRNKNPDLRPLISASKTVGKVLKSGDIVIYESTVYPGCTEEDCVPILEKVSGLRFNKDFYCGYSPERINPGDKKHTLTKILKVTSGSTPEIAQVINSLYQSIITAGTHLAPSIKVAEASKVIENSQRDINIGFVNELSMIFHRMGIDTNAVLEAAGTKWNFLHFWPGLVGGHCIGVDPYYLAQRAKQTGYHPDIILAGRRLNDNMGKEIAMRIIKLMNRNGNPIFGSKILILGITFKENCPDIRNSRVIDVINELREFGCKIDVYDPWANYAEVKKEYKIEILEDIGNKRRTLKYDAAVITVGHDKFKGLTKNDFGGQDCILFDLKRCVSPEIVDGAL
jgi:UDP-N-acetyl-D-galactosamine dehydrogenase